MCGGDAYFCQCTKQQQILFNNLPFFIWHFVKEMMKETRLIQLCEEYNNSLAHEGSRSVGVHRALDDCRVLSA